MHLGWELNPDLQLYALVLYHLIYPGTYPDQLQISLYLYPHKTAKKSEHARIAQMVEHQRVKLESWVQFPAQVQIFLLMY